MEKKSMVQKEVRKKTKIYGIVAVISALVLVSMIYAIGTTPLVYPPNQLPFVSGMKTFSSLDELRNFVNNASQGISSFTGGPLDSQYFRAASPTPTAVPSAMSPSAGSAENAPNSYWTQLSSSHSTTNVQVAGVDEADTVKTDGQYIYTVSTSQNAGVLYWNAYGYGSGGSNSVYIVNADPQNPQVISKISLGNDTEPAGLYLSQDGSKLVVLASKYQTFNYGGGIMVPGSPRIAMPMLAPYQADVYTYINVYDISDKASPVLTRNFTVSGSYFNSRMIGNNVYAVVSQPAAIYNNGVTLPAVYNGKSEISIAPTSVYYADMVQPNYYTFTSFFGINILDDTQQPTNLTVMMGGASTMYVSQSNMYVTYPTWTDGGQYTSIYRVSINGAQLSFEAQGSVPGYTINQYSMDEYNGYFRIATNWQNQTQMNNVYVLNANLSIVGKLEGLAQNENLYSVRFMGDRAYLVTFHQTDPFFIIDLSNPVAPKVAGELKIPGYSSYLHPYDENHVIGLGVENTINSGGENSNLKLALFDVTDINNPKQIAKYSVEGNYTSSTALNDPKAFLFDLQKQLLVIPVSISNYYYNIINYGGSVTGSSGGTATSNPKTIQPPSTLTPTISTESYWQGAYVFNVNPNNGFNLKGTVTQLNATQLNNQGYLTDSSNYYNSQNNWITRSLYICNTLYTISNAEIKLNSLTDLSRIAEINLT
jgi:inhibitor of cysteine peptidase